MSRACCNSRASRAFVFIEVKHSPYAWFRSDSPSVTVSAVVVLNIEYKYRNIFNLFGKCSEILYSKMEPYAKNMHSRRLEKCRIKKSYQQILYKVLHFITVMAHDSWVKSNRSDTGVAVYLCSVVL